MFNKLSIRQKLLFSYSLVLILSISMGSTIIYLYAREKITSGLESELNNTTKAILNLVRTSVNVSIKNHLRAVAEKNLEIVQYFYDQQQKGVLSESRAKELATNILLSQKIGDSGYIYCLDSEGNIIVHPETSLISTNVSSFSFVREQLAKKKSYIKYDWKNPGEAVERPKVLYMLYFEPWDWILSASSYRKEFMSLVNVEDFRESVLDLRFGKTGYSFVIDGSGIAIIHPVIQGINILKNEELPDEAVKEMQRRKSGKIIYEWKNPGEASTRSKLVIFNHIPEFNWIVGSSGYLDEFQALMRTIRTVTFVTAVLTFLVLLSVSFKISYSITAPLKVLMNNFNRMISGDFSSRMIPQSNDEIGQLAVYYNRFADQIEHYRNDLTQQMNERRAIEDALRESEARNRSVMESAPDPIVLYDINGLVTYFNPAFYRVFGWPLESCLGKKMDHFVPDECWNETHRMIDTIKAGETLSAEPTRRYTKDGDTIEVSISGSTYRNHLGEIEGSVIILRDVTKARQLQQQVMEIDDQVRRRIGQDLHDDLCPHLIGVHGLSTVLAQNLREASSPQLSLARKIVDLIDSAIEKARTLSRGLFPVHLESHGFITALEDIARQTKAVFDIDCRFEGDYEVVIEDNSIAAHLYYIVKEAVRNAIKHAEADRILILLTSSEERIHLRIVDNGKGMTRDIKKTKGIGLQIMQYRTSIIRASYQVISDSENGTTIHVSLKKDSPMINDEE